MHGVHALVGLGPVRKDGMVRADCDDSFRPDFGLGIARGTMDFRA